MVTKSREETARFCSHICLNRWLTSDENVKQKMSASLKKYFQKKENHPFFGRHHTKETRAKIANANREKRLGRTNIELFGEEKAREISEKMRVSARRKWKDADYAKRRLQALQKRPTLPEKLLNEMTPPIVQYIGNGIWWRTLPNGKHKNPDFKIKGQNKVIEVFGDYWHRNDNPRELINLYNQAGVDCLVIWENEIKNQPQIVIEKINNFINSAQG